MLGIIGNFFIASAGLATALNLKLFAIVIEEVYISMFNLLKMNYNG